MKKLSILITTFLFLQFTLNHLFAVDTALGDIPTDPGALGNKLYSIILGMAGGIALLLFLIGSFKIALSQGDPKAVAEGKSIITSAVIGLLVMIFAVAILKIAGVDIIGIPQT